MTKAVILCGGRGARFNEETEHLPKPLIEVAGKPILGHIMDIFEGQGVDEFLLAGGYRWERIADYLKTRYTAWDKPHDDLWVFGSKGERAKTFLLDTGPDRTTGGRLMCFAAHLFLTEPYFLTYGDGVSDVDLGELRRSHAFIKQSARDPIAVVTAVRPPGRFGMLDISPSGSVRGFFEKPQDEWINGGFMYVDNGALTNELMVHEMKIQREPFPSLEEAALPRLAAKGRLFAHRHSGYWRCMDTRRDLEQIEEDVRAAGRLPWLREGSPV